MNKFPSNAYSAMVTAILPETVGKNLKRKLKSRKQTNGPKSGKQELPITALEKKVK